MNIKEAAFLGAFVPTNEKMKDGITFFSLKKLLVLLSPRTGVRFSVAAATFLLGAKSKNTRVIEVSGHFEYPHVVKINPEPSTTPRLITCVASAP